MRSLGVLVTWLLIGCSATMSHTLAERETSKVALPCPLAFDGLVPGSSREANVVAMYGKGQYDSEGGDTGARSYSGQQGRLVHFVFGVDHVLDRIIIEKPAAIVESPKDVVELDAVRFWRRFLPGLTRRDVELALGGGDAGDTTELIYRPDGGACSSGGFVAFEIDIDHVQRVIIASGDDG